jgi:hypothetical protein
MKYMRTVRGRVALFAFFVWGCQLQAQVSFYPSCSPTVGAAPIVVTTADLNGDGKLELVCANSGGDTLSILTNDGSGGFAVASSPVVASNPEAVTAADLNGDGKLELICSIAGGNSLLILTNDGGGGYVEASSLTVGSNPSSVIAADVNGDGKLDLICANYGYGNGNTLSVLTNNGSGGFVLSSSPTVGGGPNLVVAADVNGDGKLDLISANYGAYGSGSTLSVLTNDGSGGFVLATSPSVGNGPWSVCAADVNGDGKLDLISANRLSSTLSVLTNDGSGGFVLASSPAVGNGAQAVVSADVNGDGWVDLISANSGTNTLSVLTNNGSGGFTLACSPTVGSYPVWVTATDVNGDGKLDLICANYADGTLSVLTNATPFSSLNFLTNGLVAYYPFNGNAKDASGNGNNGTMNGAIFATNRFGQTNSAVYFNNDTISTSFFPPLGTSSRAFSGWFNTISSQQMVFLAYGGGLPTAGDRFELGISSGNLYLDVDAGTLRTANSYNDGNWHQFIVVAPTNGSLATVSCFVDGRLQTNTTYDSDTSINTVGSDPLILGELYLTGYERYFVGSLDDLRIYSRALASNEVAQLYAYESVPTATPPVITGQPASQTVDQGSAASFSVTAAGTGLNYQWQFNAVKISGATNADYAIASASTNNAGNYDVVVSDAGGWVMSSNAALTVIPAPRAAAGTATLTGSFVTGITIFDGGSGYTNAPVVRLIGGGGSGAEAFAVVSNGTLISITVTNAGYGYTNTPVVVIDPPFIFNPILGISPCSYLVFSNLTVGGTYELQEAVLWYWVNQSDDFTTTNPVYAQMVAGANGEYRLALNPVPTQAFATAELFNDFVVGATIDNGGSGYVTSPAVSIVGGGGEGAEAYATLSDGVVTSITVTNAGFDYTNAPTIEIAAPPAASVTPTVIPVMRVDVANLAPYDNYQIQFTPIINGTWANWNGGLFTPTATTNSQYIFVTNEAGFFRVRYAP